MWVINRIDCCIIYHYFPNILFKFSYINFYSQLSTINYKIRFMCQYKSPARIIRVQGKTNYSKNVQFVKTWSFKNWQISVFHNNSLFSLWKTNFLVSVHSSHSWSWYKHDIPWWLFSNPIPDIDIIEITSGSRLTKRNPLLYFDYAIISINTNSYDEICLTVISNTSW